MNKLPIKNFTKVLDAGCGNGEYAIKIAKMFPHIQVTGIDITQNWPQTSLPANVEFRKEDLLEMKATGVYDFIYSIDVLEHIPGNEEVIKNFYTSLKPGAYLYLHIPYDINKKRIFPERFFKAFNNWAAVEHIGRQYSLDELQKVLVDTGFDVVAAEHSFGLIGEFAWELDRMTDGKSVLKILLMPFLRLLSQVSVKIKYRKGNTLIIGKKIRHK